MDSKSSTLARYIFVLDPWKADTLTHFATIEEAFQNDPLKCEILLYGDHLQSAKAPRFRAFITVRTLWGEAQAMRYLKTVLTKEHQTLSSLLKEAPMAEPFLELYQSPRSQLLIEHDHAKARSMGATLSPSLVYIDTSGHMVCTKGKISLTH